VASTRTSAQLAVRVFACLGIKNGLLNVFWPLASIDRYVGIVELSGSQVRPDTGLGRACFALVRLRHGHGEIVVPESGPCLAIDRYGIDDGGPVGGAAAREAPRHPVNPHDAAVAVAQG